MHNFLLDVGREGCNGLKDGTQIISILLFDSPFAPEEHGAGR